MEHTAAHQGRSHLSKRIKKMKKWYEELFENYGMKYDNRY